jgi:hypothetical protein
LTVAVLALVAGPAFAAGTDDVDGFWQVQSSKVGGGVSTTFASVRQNDSFLSAGFNVLVINLNLDGSWGFAFATRTGSTVQGNLFAFDGTSVGTSTFTLTSATTFSGQSTIQGVTHTLSGTKLF